MFGYNALIRNYTPEVYYGLVKRSYTDFHLYRNDTGLHCNLSEGFLVVKDAGMVIGGGFI